MGMILVSFILNVVCVNVFLFHLICVEGFNAILQSAVARGNLSHLLFADDSFLGLPSLIGRNKSEAFEFIKEKAWNRTKGWRNKMLSNAGKEILLKSVVQTLLSLQVV